MKQNIKIKIAILALTILLTLSLLALGGMILYHSFKNGRPVTDSVPDNFITPEAGGTAISEQDKYCPAVRAVCAEAKEPNGGNKRTSSVAAGADAAVAVSTKAVSAKAASAKAVSDDVKKKSAVISLYQNHAEDNQPFQSGNMFPGDTEAKYYCVKISHSDDVTVHYRADIRPGYEKLAEVLRCRISLLTTGDVLYDGLMQQMPESLSYGVETDNSTESELYYEISVYLDTSVGNEYQNKDLIADFRWWVQETGSLTPPQTGDAANTWIYVLTAAGSILAILLLWKGRRKEEKTNG